MQCWHISLVGLVSMFVRLQAYILAPILPLEIKRRGIDQTFTGVILSAYSFGLLIVPPFVTKVCFKHCERRMLAQLGGLILSISLLCYGL